MLYKKHSAYSSMVALFLVAALVFLGSCVQRKVTSLPTPELKKHDRLVLNLSFDADKATLKDTDYEKLNAAIDFIKKFKGSNITVEGHTDNAGSREYNHDLSHKRAEAVKRYLSVHGGIPEAKIKTIGYGESRPVAPNDTELGREKNRRVELLITPD